MCAVKNNHVIGPSRVPRGKSTQPIYQSSTEKRSLKKRKLADEAETSSGADTVFSGNNKKVTRKKTKAQTVAVRLR